MNSSEHIPSLDLFRHEMNSVETQLKMLTFHMEIQTNACKGEPKPVFCTLGVWEVSLDIKAAFALARAVMNNSFRCLTGSQAAGFFQTGKLFLT